MAYSRNLGYTPDPKEIVGMEAIKVREYSVFDCLQSARKPQSRKGIDRHQHGPDDDPTLILALGKAQDNPDVLRIGNR